MPGESARLEELWAGEFGDSYTERNAAAARRRGDFWERLLSMLDVVTALEVGCNVGGNLVHVAGRLGSDHVWGLDINASALTTLKRALPGVNAVLGSGRDLPFGDGEFDLVFTVGVLIHQPDESLPAVMDEMVRCSRRYVLAAEYHAEETTEVPYRGERGALFKRNYRTLFEQRFAGLRHRESGFLSADYSGFDDVTYILFEQAAV